MVVAIPLGLDSFLACLGLGLLVANQQPVWRTAAWFGLCDAVALVLGVIAGEASLATAAGSLAIGLPALCAAILIMVEVLRGTRRLSGYSLILPIVFSTDDFLFGIHLTDSPLQTLEVAAVLAVKSACLSLAGLWLGTIIARWMRPPGVVGRVAPAQS